MTLGGWLGGSIAWHFAAMWLLVANGLFYLGYGSQRPFPPAPAAAARADVVSDARPCAFACRIIRRVQRRAEAAVLGGDPAGHPGGAVGARAVEAGAAGPLADLFGGFDFARKVHFAAMAGIAAFVVVHLALVAIVPKTLPMLVGRGPTEGNAQ
jgi:hypothetical protein